MIEEEILCKKGFLVSEDNKKQSWSIYGVVMEKFTNGMDVAGIAEEETEDLYNHDAKHRGNS